MGIVGNRLEKPISISNLRTLLVNSSWSLGNLCTSSTIAKWAKYKPVRHSSTAELTEAQRKSVNCGMVAPTDSSGNINALNHPEDAAARVWVYNRPRGYNGGGAGVHEWYRMLDFNGYDRTATNPPTKALSSTYYKVWGGGVNLFSNTSTSGTIQYGDINATIQRSGKAALALGSWYMAVIVKAGSNRWIKTTSNNLSVSPMVNLTSDDIKTIDPVDEVGSISFFVVLCDTKIESMTLFNADNPNYFFYPALCDLTSQVNGTITINHTSGMSMSVISLNGGNSIPSAWPPESAITPYVGPPSGGTNRYLSISSTYTLALKVRINNNTSTTRTINVGNMQCRLSNNFVGNVKPVLSPKGVYNTSNTAISSVTINANSYADIIVLLPDNFYRLNASLQPQNVTAGQSIYPTISLTNYGAAFVSVVVKVSN